MKKYACLLLLSVIFCHAQDSIPAANTKEKTNPIIFSEAFLGGAGGSSHGLSGGFTLNYQHRNDLFTARILGVADLNEVQVLVSLTGFPVSHRVETITEYSLLYGKRYIFENKSLGFSVGISKISREYITGVDGEYVFNEDNYGGFPFEVNFKWFKPSRERIRIYGLIPLGPPTALGGSFGFKVFGNISKTNFIGVGLVYGFGWHKHY